MKNVSHAIILAAGRNTRLDKGIPKSLTSLISETIMERHIRIFSNFGVREFCVIGGYQFEKLSSFLETLAVKYQVEIEVFLNDDLDKENGYSVMQSKFWVQKKGIDHALLTMGDHIFHSELIHSFLNKTVLNNASLYLATDRPGVANKHIDLEDVTKVKTSVDDEILEIGKGLKDFNCFDTGLFMIHKSLFEEFDAVFGQGKYGISDVVRSLSTRKSAYSVDVSGFAWNDIDNELDLKNTVEMIKLGRL